MDSQDSNNKVEANNQSADANTAEKNKDEKIAKFGVLIIEEKADLRTFYMSALTKTGNYEVKNSATPKEALELLEEEYSKINLIIFDWVMSEIPGSVFSQKIRMERQFNNIELLVCSSELDNEDSFLMTEMDIHYVMQKSTNAGEYIAKIEEVRAHYKNSTHVVSNLKNLQNLMDDVQLEKCEELFNDPEIEKEVNTNPRYVHLGGEMRILRRKYEEASEFLKNCLVNNSSPNGTDNLKSLSTLGKALCLGGKFDDALLIYQKLESKSPKNLSHKVMVGDALLGMDDIAGAEKKYGQVLKEDSTHKGALVGMGKATAAEGKFEESKSFFAKIEGTFESRALASFFNNRGVALVRGGKVNEAIQFYENALQFLDKFKGHVYFNLGMAYYRIGNIASAINCFQSALKSNEASQLVDKTILKELQEKGPDNFIAEYNARSTTK